MSRLMAVSMACVLLAGVSPSQAQNSSPPALAPPAVSPAPAAQTLPPAAPPLAAPAIPQQPVETPEPDLPHDLSPIGMFMAADIVVKSIMTALAFASVLTWSIWLAKVLELMSVRRRSRRDYEIIAQSATMSEAEAKLRNSESDVAILCRAAASEIRRSANAINPDGLRERIGSLFHRIEAAAGRRMTRGTGILATIGSTGPFIGLFGTVWGIMNSFIGISKSQTTNLAVVAPGIAEALLATALGLVAAIPAVMIFNMFARSITGYRALLGDASAELMRMVSRDLDHGLLTRAALRAAAE